MTDIRFTAEQIAALRRALGVPDGDPDPTAADLAIVVEAEMIANGAPDWRQDGPES